MYFILALLLFLALFCFLLARWRAAQICQRIRCMKCCKKLRILHSLLSPFGFLYCGGQDIVTSSTDAWQRNFGYRTLFDRTAPRFHILFDREPIYFDYDGRTWLIELWKGQYGINTGAEIGVYYADTLLSPTQYDKAQFHSIPNERFLRMSMKLYHHERLLFTIQQTHWWLTGFCPGLYSRPYELTMRACITFPTQEMLSGFLQGLTNAGYDRCCFCVCGLTVSILFSTPCAKQFRPAFFVWRSDWQNRLSCCLYRFLMRPFACTMDRLLYLYYLLPPLFRRLLFFRKNGHQKRPRF